MIADVGAAEGEARQGQRTEDETHDQKDEEEASWANHHHTDVRAAQPTAPDLITSADAWPLRMVAEYVLEQSANGDLDYGPF